MHPKGKGELRSNLWVTSGQLPGILGASSYNWKPRSILGEASGQPGSSLGVIARKFWGSLWVTRLGLWCLCVPQMTQASFLQKQTCTAEMAQWRQNHEIWTFKLNFLCQKNVLEFLFFH